KRENRDGPAVMGDRAPLQELAVEDVARDLERDRITFVDTRPVSQVHAGTVRGSISIPAPSKMATYGGWAYDPEKDDRPLVLLAQDQEQAQRFWDHLVRVGIDRVAGYVTGIEGLPTTTPEVTQPEELESFDAALVLDVRNKSEHSAGHTPGSRHLSAGRV